MKEIEKGFDNSTLADKDKIDIARNQIVEMMDQAKSALADGKFPLHNVDSKLSPKEHQAIWTKILKGEPVNWKP